MTLSTHTRRQLSYAEGYLTLGLKAEAPKTLNEIVGEEREATPVLTIWMAVHVERSAWARAAKVGAVFYLGL